MVTNRVFKVKATNGVTMTSLADTTVGRYLVIKEDGSTVVAATPLDREDKIQIVVNTAVGKDFGDKIRVGDITSYLTQAYAARVEQVTTLTPGTIVAGQEYTVSVILKSDKEILQARQNKRTYTVVAVTGETATTLVAKFVAQINADQASSVTASGTTTLVLTAKPVSADRLNETEQQNVFDVFASVIDPTTYPIGFPQAFGTIVATTAPSFGQGQYTQLVRLEQLSQGYKGNTNRTLFPANPVISQLTAGGTYDVAVIESDNRHDTNVVVEGEKHAPITTIVAVTAGASAGLFAIFARLALSGDVA